MSSAVRTSSPSTSTSLSSTYPPSSSSDDTYPMTYVGNLRKKNAKSISLENLLEMSDGVTSENSFHIPRKYTSLTSKSQPSPSSIKTVTQHLVFLPSSTPKTESTTSKILTVGASMSTTACPSSQANTIGSISSVDSASISAAVTASNSSSIRHLTSATCRENSLVVNPSTSTSSDPKFYLDIAAISVTASDSKSEIVPALISMTTSPPKCPIYPSLTSFIAKASKSPSDFAQTLKTAMPATFSDVTASNSSVNLASTSATTTSLTAATASVSDSPIASPSSTVNTSASKSPGVRPSTDSTSPSTSLLGFKRPLSSSYTSTSPLKQTRFKVIVDSEAINNTKSVNESNPVSIIRPDTVPKLFRPFEDLEEPVSLYNCEESKHQTNSDVASVHVRQCNFPGSSLQAAPDVAIKYPEDLVSSSSLDEVADPTRNFQDQHETESMSSTSTVPSFDESPAENPITKAFDIVQTCASLTMRNVPRRSRFCERVFSRGNDTNNNFFASEANNLLNNLPQNIAIECKGFIWQFLEEVLEYSATNGKHKD